MVPYTIVTPTGDRPRAFALCCDYVQRQVVQPAEWIVVDDGQVPTVPVLQLPYMQYVRRTRQASDPQHTLPVQLSTALRRVTTDYAIIMEDDDWYDPVYTQKLMEVFIGDGKPAIVGQGETIYYHLPSRQYLLNRNKQHASLCQTGFSMVLADRVVEVCNNCVKKPFIDIGIWRLKAPKQLLPGTPPLCIGMKGLPGRAGQTMGWNEKHPLYKPDPDQTFLYSCIGTDVAVYREICAGAAQCPPCV